MHALLLALLIVLMCPLPLSFSAVFICPHPEGDLYTDHGEPGCRALETPPSAPATPRGTPPPAPAPPTEPSPRSSAPSKSLSHQPFEPVSVLYPAINYYGGSGLNYVPNAGEVMREEIIVQYVANGSGPKFRSVGLLDESASRGLVLAAVTASTAVGYDPAYLEVQYDPIPHLKQVLAQLKDLPPTMRPRISGNSASGMWAIVIAAALLGDTLRPDACMTGTIEADTTIGFVGKADQKIYGCAKERYREMVIPFGQKDMTLSGKAMSLGVTITEVRTFAEAYEVMTGKPLRFLAGR